MWFCRKPTFEEIKNKAFRFYVGRADSDYLDKKFPKIQSRQIKTWSQEFGKIISEIERLIEKDKGFDHESFVREISALSPFLDKKSLDKAGWYAGYFAWRQGYKRK